MARWLLCDYRGGLSRWGSTCPLPEFLLIIRTWRGLFLEFGPAEAPDTGLVGGCWRWPFAPGCDTGSRHHRRKPAG